MNMGFDDYKSKVLKAFERTVMFKTQKEARVIGEKIIEDALGDGLQKPVKLSGDARKRFVGSHVQCITDIGLALDELESYPIYFRRYPYTNAGVSKVTYLRHNIEGYLQAVYVLKERIKKHLARMERLYRNDPRGRKITSKFKQYNKAIEKILDEVLLAQHLSFC